ncbi:MAG: hypothetical protein EOS55_18245 [Mesorhizobium sp.]|nr:MAG: hypothetical protein EOS55_18245 [Mesorhizobium sp.]
MATLIGKSGLKAEQRMEIGEALAAVNGRASRWTASVAEVVDWLETAEGQLQNAGLPATYRVGATADCFTSAPSAKSYRYAVTGNRVLLRRFGKEWRVVGIETIGLYPRDSRADKVKVSLSSDQIERVKAAAAAPFALQPKPEPIQSPFDGPDVDCYDAEGRLQKAA